MLNPKKFLKQFGLFWLVFIVLQFIVSTTPVRNTLAELNTNLFTKAAQWYLPEINLQGAMLPKTGEIQFRFYSELEVQEKLRTSKTGSVNVTTYEHVNNPSSLFNPVVVFLIALFLATPLAWRKRLTFAGIGLVLFYLYTLLRMSVKLQFEISRLNIGLYESDPSSFFHVAKVSNFLSSLGFILIFVVFIWAVLVFSKKNIKEMKTNLS